MPSFPNRRAIRSLPFQDFAIGVDHYVLLGLEGRGSRAELPTNNNKVLVKQWGKV